MIVLFVVVLLVVCALAVAGIAALCAEFLPDSLESMTVSLISGAISMVIVSLFTGVCMSLTISAGWW